jgi:hypothetical protein
MRLGPRVTARQGRRALPFLIYMNEPLELDPLALFREADAVRAGSLEAERRFRKLTRRVFQAEAGRDWLRAAILRYNFMGSVFSADDAMDALHAAHRDGMRAVISDIVNATVPAKGKNEDDDES